MSDDVLDKGSKMTRRRVLSLGLGLVGAGVGVGVALGVGRVAGGGLGMKGRGWFADRLATSGGRLAARPGRVESEGPRGLQELKLEEKRDGLVYVPASHAAARTTPLVLMLHGAGGSARRAVTVLQKLADEAGLILLVPDSRRDTWDVIEGGYGPDVKYIDRALAQTFGRYAIDSARIAVAGFSDGASYALSLGVTNGDLFTHILAFSPGFMVPGERRGSPALFVSHGTQDRVLPIERCSRRIVPEVKRAGYRVEYREFDGPHTVPPEMARAAVEWFVKGGV